MASLLLFNNYDGTSMNYIWQIYAGGHAVDFLKDMKRAASTPEIRDRFGSIAVYSKRKAPWDTTAWLLAAKEPQLSEMEEDKVLSVVEIDSMQHVSREDAFRLVINECIALQKDDEMPSQLLRDLYSVGFDAVERSLFWSLLEIHIISRDMYDASDTSVRFSSMRIHLNFTKRTWWDIFTNNHYKSPCTAGWTKASLICSKKLVDELDRM